MPMCADFQLVTPMQPAKAGETIVMLVTVTVLVAVLGTVKFRQIQAAVAQASSFQPPPEAVTGVGS